MEVNMPKGNDLICLAFTKADDEEMELEVEQLFDMFEEIEIISQSQSSYVEDETGYTNLIFIVKGKWKDGEEKVKPIVKN
jgi:hypothetical protein